MNTSLLYSLPGAWRVRRYFDKCLEFYRRNRDRNYFRKIRGKYCGRRGFVIGNGPSLSNKDLDLLRNEITIGSNKIYLAFSSTEWRPTFYTIADPLVWDKIRNVISAYFRMVLIPSYLKPRVCGCQVRVYKTLHAADKQVDIDFSEDFTKGFYPGYTVTYDNLQLAVHLGLNPIYLIGCDHSYAGESNVVANQAVISREINHFHPDYRVVGEKVNPAPLELMDRSFACAARYAEKNGFKIYNATRGGALEVFPRVNLDDVLSEDEV